MTERSNIGGFRNILLTRLVEVLGCHSDHVACGGDEVAIDLCHHIYFQRWDCEILFVLDLLCSIWFSRPLGNLNLFFIPYQEQPLLASSQ